MGRMAPGRADEAKTPGLPCPSLSSLALLSLPCATCATKLRPRPKDKRQLKPFRPSGPSHLIRLDDL
ncbi:hypothetical protein BDA96_02G237500 [Sorghum bicolor]|uniref:Uncharacterized protein n=1 Tax=Sorghum bicolor TaxID=4558 RepID=A0A921RQJ9_SORBI|nr:hypothetical protein BDA96_02G237500 [Sorghum bicolor]